MSTDSILQELIRRAEQHLVGLRALERSAQQSPPNTTDAGKYQVGKYPVRVGESVITTAGEYVYISEYAEGGFLVRTWHEKKLSETEAFVPFASIWRHVTYQETTEVCGYGRPLFYPAEEYAAVFERMADKLEREAQDALAEIDFIPFH